jgi:probable addiction module antidote protein
MRLPYIKTRLETLLEIRWGGISACVIFLDTLPKKIPASSAGMVNGASLPGDLDANNLRTEEQAVLFLEVWFEEAGDDAAFIAAALGEIARAHGMTEIANATGLTREGLYKTPSKDGNPSFAAILKVMKALGLKLKPEAA